MSRFAHPLDANLRVNLRDHLILKPNYFIFSKIYVEWLGFRTWFSVNFRQSAASYP